MSKSSMKLDPFKIQFSTPQNRWVKHNLPRCYRMMQLVFLILFCGNLAMMHHNLFMLLVTLAESLYIFTSRSGDSSPYTWLSMQPILLCSACMSRPGCWGSEVCRRSIIITQVGSLITLPASAGQRWTFIQRNRANVLGPADRGARQEK